MSAADLQSKDHRDLLDIIDQLRSQGINQYVDLPEIIVCGDQCAGKSSVLEAISGMSFPTKDSLCTRFATELILRRDLTINVKVSITPDPGRFPDEKEALTSWQPEVNLENDGLKQIIEEAKIKMGLQGTKIFSNDILRVELSGPDQPHLTMVDLPGLFKAGNKEQSADNVEMVRNMVTNFMKRPRSIILAVVSAKTEYVLQEVTALAKEADPDGLRTIGLITKPDTLDAGSDSEGKWVDLALNKDVTLNLGWHVLKNRSYDERDYTSAQRDTAEEEFFSQGIWTSIDSGSCGIRSLKSRLSSVLKRQIMQQLPSLVEDVERSIHDCKLRLDRLGAARSSPEEQLQYLSRVSQDFTSLTKAAVDGNYNHVFFGDKKTYDGYNKRLRAVVQNLLAEFSRHMRSDGESQIIIDSDVDEDTGPGRITRSKYIEDVKARMCRSRGCELPGLFNALIVGELFSRQCQPWGGIVLELTQHILDNVYQATRLIIEQTAASEVAEEILVIINNEIEKLKMDMDQTIDGLLQPHYGLHAITYNPQLTANVQEAQRARNKRAITRKIKETFGTKHFKDPDSKIYINPAQIVDLFLNETEQDMDRFGSSIAVDYMQAYYKVSPIYCLLDFTIIFCPSNHAQFLSYRSPWIGLSTTSASLLLKDA